MPPVPWPSNTLTALSSLLVHSGAMTHVSGVPSINMGTMIICMVRGQNRSFGAKLRVREDARSRRLLDILGAGGSNSARQFAAS